MIHVVHASKSAIEYNQILFLNKNEYKYMYTKHFAEKISIFFCVEEKIYYMEIPLSKYTKQSRISMSVSYTKHQLLGLYLVY